MKTRAPSRLEKKSRRGHRGYPMATVAFYGRDAMRASKVTFAIIPAEDAEPSELKRWFSEAGDVRPKKPSARGVRIGRTVTAGAAKSCRKSERPRGE